MPIIQPGRTALRRPPHLLPFSMKTTYRITELAKQHRLSRSTLLYYDRCGLLKPSARSSSGYRLYSEKDAKRLAEICRYRATGLSLDDIRRLLGVRPISGLHILKNRLSTLQQELLLLQQQQNSLCKLIHALGGQRHFAISREMWINLLQQCGFQEEDMIHWHAEFERTAPEAHEAFLVWLGIPMEEVTEIRLFASHHTAPHHNPGE